MIYLFFGENFYQRRQVLDSLVLKFKQNHGEHAVENVDGENLQSQQLLDLLGGATLFAPERLVIIRSASKNKDIWDKIGEKLSEIPSSVTLVLVENNPDKRTKTFKALQKQAEAREFKQIEENAALNWLVEEAKKRGGEIKKQDAKTLVQRVGVEVDKDKSRRSDQMRLSNELDKLLLYGDTTQEGIEKLVERTPQENAFALLDAGLNGNTRRLRKLLVDAKVTEDPYKLFGLLSAQVLQLAALVYGENRSSAEIARELGVHPYPLQKLSPVARQTSAAEMKKIVEIMADLDNQMKSTGMEPWQLMEAALLKISSIGD